MPDSNFKLTSTAFEDGQPIPTRYTCDGENLHPALTITGVPEHTQSLALTVDDPDSPSRSFTHWVLANIPPTTENILENQLPPGSTEGINSFGQTGYGGPCPHQGEHHYVFSLYALDTPLSSDQLKTEQIKLMKEHILASTSLTGLYRRSI